MVLIFRSGCGGDRFVAEDAAGDESFRVRDLQQRVPTRPEPAASPARSQLAVEAPAENDQGGTQAGLRVSRAFLRAPQPDEGSRRPHRHQEALLPEARREEVEVRAVLQEVRRAIRLEGAHEDLWHQRVQMRLWNTVL